jgi:hypothetical protein
MDSTKGSESFGRYGIRERSPGRPYDQCPIMADVSSTQLSDAVPDRQVTPGNSVLSSRLLPLRALLGIGIAVVLVVPESEIRQKAFKANLVAKHLLSSSVQRHGSR